MTTHINEDHFDAGFRSRQDPDGAVPDAKQQKLVRLSEVRQLLVPAGTPLPDTLAKLSINCTDLVQLGHELFQAHTTEKPILIVGMSDPVAQAALQYPSLFNLQAAVITDIPGADYSPIFNQAVFGMNKITWSYLLDSLGMDDKLNFDVSAKSSSDPDDMDPAPMGPSGA